MSDLRPPFDSAHPDEALAGLVDGTLTPAERAELQAHLDGCERCRAELALAESAAQALRSLPELDAPWGLGREAIAEAGKGAARPDRSRRFAMVAGIAAALILVVGLSVAVLRSPNGGGNANSAGAVNTTGATSGPVPAGKIFAPRAPVIVKSTKNFSAEDVAGLATDYSARAARSSSPRATSPEFASAAPTSGAATSGPFTSGITGGGTTAGTTGTAGGGTSAPAGSSGPETSGAVGLSGTSAQHDLAAQLGPVACVDRAAGYARSTLPVRVIDARYEEKPALIGIFLQGAGANQQVDLVVVWVASKECNVLSYASHRVTP